MRGAEFGHLMLFVISLPVIVWLAIEQQWAIAISMALIDISWNIYPVMLQRSNRARLARLQHRFPTALRYTDPDARISPVKLHKQ